MIDPRLVGKAALVTEASTNSIRVEPAAKPSWDRQTPLIKYAD